MTALTRTISAPGTSSTGSSIRSVIDGVDLRQRDHTALDAEQLQDLHVLEGLRARAFAGIDDEQEEIDPGRARHHRAHEALVAGDVDHRQPPPTRQLERRVAELDRDPARLFLG